MHERRWYFSHLLTVMVVAILGSAAGWARSDGNRFEYPPLGWQMPIPAGWTVQSEAAGKAIRQRGAALIGAPDEALEQQKIVLSLRSTSGMFAAALDPLPFALFTPEMHQLLFETQAQMVAGAFRRSSLRAELGDIEQRSIGGKRFLAIRFDLFSLQSEHDSAIATQWMYQSVAGEELLTVTFAALVEEIELIERAWQQSTFASEAKPASRKR